MQSIILGNTASKRTISAKCYAVFRVQGAEPPLGFGTKSQHIKASRWKTEHLSVFGNMVSERTISNRCYTMKQKCLLARAFLRSRQCCSPHIVRSGISRKVLCNKTFCKYYTTFSLGLQSFSKQRPRMPLAKLREKCRVSHLRRRAYTYNKEP